MYEILKNGGLGSGGLNFDAKVRRGSFAPEDLFEAHIAGMDSFAIGLKVAKKLLDDKALENIIEDRYQSFTDGIGKQIVDGTVGLKELEEYALNLGEIKQTSGKLERIKSTINQYLLTAYAE
jgi:xylose isomerase